MARDASATEEEEDRADAEALRQAKLESVGDFRSWRDVVAEIDAEDCVELRRPARQFR